MSEHIDKNKIDDKTKRRAEHIEDRLEKKGMGRDEAEKRAIAEAMSEHPKPGGSSSGGEAKKKDASQGGDWGTGSPGGGPE